jgi:hypothetical protein
MPLFVQWSNLKGNAVQWAQLVKVYGSYISNIEQLGLSSSLCPYYVYL